jgi:hypothetical protein
VRQQSTTALRHRPGSTLVSLPSRRASSPRWVLTPTLSSVASGYCTLRFSRNSRFHTLVPLWRSPLSRSGKEPNPSCLYIPPPVSGRERSCVITLDCNDKKQDNRCPYDECGKWRQGETGMQRKFVQDRITTNIKIDVDGDEDAWYVQDVTMKQREGRNLVRIKIWGINGRGRTLDNRQGSTRRSGHINPAALRSFCNLASSTQACASRTSGSEEGLPISMLFSPWLILAAVSTEIVAELGEIGSSSREREKPCRSIA